MDNQTSLLKVPAEYHRTSLVTNEPDLQLRNGSHKMGVPYHDLMEGALVRLGLYQMVNVHNCQIDPALITALVERWRPETNTFHLPVGECTVTLEDVNLLWGLPITGRAITGRCDEDWSQAIHELLGHEPNIDYNDLENCIWKWNWKKDKETNEKKLSISHLHIRLKWLKMNFLEVLSPNDSKEKIDCFTRAYCMGLFGSVMFPDTSANGVPAFYLQFLEELDQPKDYNWGGAVLAYLYRELSRACMSSEKSICGPVLLLQMWSWTRFPVGRPDPRDTYLSYGGSNLHLRNAFGVKWINPHSWIYNSRNATSHYRQLFGELTQDVVNWHPYMDYYELAPFLAQRDWTRWYIRTYLIHFWIVEPHHPDRVMRQFNLFQNVPPPNPLNWEVLQDLRNVTHESGIGHSLDWRKELKEYVDDEGITVYNSGKPYEGSRNVNYMHWYFKNGMISLYPQQNNPTRLTQPMPPPEENVEDLGFVPQDQRHARMLYRHLGLTAQAIQWCVTPGQVSYGALLLSCCRDNLADLGHLDLYIAMVAEARIPANPDDIDTSLNIPDERAAEQNVHFTQEDCEAVMRGQYSSLTNVLNTGYSQTSREPSSSSMPAPCRSERQHVPR